MNLFEETKFLMKKYGITANKNLGQNFLIDESVIIDACDSANINKEDLVIEIGPGLGTLTKYILERAGKVICVELDERMIDILKERFFLYENFEIINEDILKVDLHKLIKEEKNENIKNVKIVANLPYYITTPIIMKLLEERLDLQSITVMVQKEVAERLIAVPGEKFTGAITYSVYYYADSENVRVVDKSSFIPEPSVESEVINLKIRENPPVNVNNEELFFKLIKIAFMQRRKTLVNSLSNSGFIEKNKIIEILKQLNINENIRAEKLSIQDFANIANKI
jgi:16S rRNA (adenine1518-N6/adenine1519-N6)-dimethyltransferase